MHNNEPSTSGRLLSAIIAMCAWSLALVCWQMISNPKDWLSIAPIGTPTFTIQMIVLFGSAIPLIGLGLSLLLESKDDRRKP